VSAEDVYKTNQSNVIQETPSKRTGLRQGPWKEDWNSDDGGKGQGVYIERRRGEQGTKCM
jgi:hypothetical protein